MSSLPESNRRPRGVKKIINIWEVHNFPDNSILHGGKVGIIYLLNGFVLRVFNQCPEIHCTIGPEFDSAHFSFPLSLRNRRISLSLSFLSQCILGKPCRRRETFSAFWL